MAIFHSKDGKIPEVDLRKMDNISTLVSTFEERDLVTRNILNFFFDKQTEYVFIDIWSYINGETKFDNLLGFDKDKLIAICQNILDYFNKNENEKI